jgi:hypothetical protein
LVAIINQNGHSVPAEIQANTLKPLAHPFGANVLWVVEHRQNICL